MENDDIYEGCDFDAKLEIYWDALDISEESALNIIPPNFEPTVETPSKSTSSIGKHKRDEESNDFGEEVDGVKAMRYGSLGRIIANSVAASSILDKKRTSFHQYENDLEFRKSIVGKFMKFLNFGDMNGLANLIREFCSEACFLITPDLKEPIVGKGEVMMLFSLLFEAYPDGVWTVVSITPLEYTIISVYRFTGTKVFNFPIDLLFKQIREHSKKEASLIEHSEDLVNNVAEHCPPPSQNTLSSPVMSTSRNSSDEAHSNSNRGSGNFNGTHGKELIRKPSGLLMHEDHTNGLEPSSPKAINIPHRPSSMRDMMGTLEKTVLKNGSVIQKRKMEFIFDEYNQIVRIVITNL